MVAFTKLLHALLPLGVMLSAVGALASPANGPARMDKRVSDTALQNRWDALYRQIGKNGLQTLCQAILPHATATKTAIIISATPTTASETAYTTEVATEIVTETSLEQSTVTETALETTTITMPGPERRDLSEAMRRLFQLLFADANAWTIAKCRTLTSPLTDAVTTTTTTYTPSVAETATSIITVQTTTTATATTTETSVNTVQVTSIATATVVVPAPRFCPTQLPAPVPVARLLNVDLLDFDLSEEDGGNAVIPIATEAECIRACASNSLCHVYFWWPLASNCYLKGSGWGASDFYTDRPAAMDPGSVTGVLRSSCGQLRGVLTVDVHERCCNNN